MIKRFKWDWVVKTTHWSVAILFLSNYFLLEEGDDFHKWAGYAIVFSISIRLLWGLVTHSPARLSRFLPSVPLAIQHLKEVIRDRKDEHEGHNPAGAIMIWTLWSLILSTALTGWSMEFDYFWGENWMEELHEILANMALFAVVLHVCAIIVMSKINRKSYIKTMLP